MCAWKQFNHGALFVTISGIYHDGVVEPNLSWLKQKTYNKAWEIEQLQGFLWNIECTESQAGRAERKMMVCLCSPLHLVFEQFKIDEPYCTSEKHHYRAGLLSETHCQLVKKAPFKCQPGNFCFLSPNFFLLRREPNRNEEHGKRECKKLRIEGGTSWLLGLSSF